MPGSSLTSEPTVEAASFLPAPALDDVLEAEAEVVRRQPGRVVVPSPGELRGVPAVGSGPWCDPRLEPGGGAVGEGTPAPVVDAFEVRAEAAADLARKGLIDGMLALSYVVWPSVEVEAASDVVAVSGGRRRYSDAQRLRALELVDGGFRGRRPAVRLACRRRRCGTWIKKRSVA